MAKSVLVDAGFLVALLNRRDANHDWAIVRASEFRPPWRCCDAVLSEAFYLSHLASSTAWVAMLRRRTVLSAFHLGDDVEAIAGLMHKYADVPMSFADACLVRMTETFADPILLTTDTDFRIYRRHGRQIIPCNIPD